jgi:hypothetical protein
MTIACCAFWGLMQFGEVTVKNGVAFSASKHTKCSDMVLLKDQCKGMYTWICLLLAKTAATRTTQGHIPAAAALVPSNWGTRKLDLRLTCATRQSSVFMD